MPQIQPDESPVDELFALKNEIDSFLNAQDAAQAYWDGSSEYEELLSTSHDNAQKMKQRNTLTTANAQLDEELTEQEMVERHRLELKVERAFVEAGWALRQLRDKRLYRSTHKTFEQYCLDQFGFQRRHSYRLIDAATVIDNLCPIGTQKGEIVGTQIRPTNERQVRDLVGLAPEEQRQIWDEAIRAAGGKLPSGRVVQSIVQQMKERGATSLPIPFQKGDVVLIRGAGNPDLRKYDGQWAIAMQINEYTVTVALNEKELAVKPQFLEEVGSDYWTEIKAVNERITRLQLDCELDPMEDAGLEVLRRRTSFTPKQKRLLAFLEQEYGIN